MDVKLVNHIKRLCLIALASDDKLVEALVLKGGNAIDLAYSSDNTISRSSYDLDFSITNGDFEEDVESISKRIEGTLTQTFLENELIIIDYKFLSKPKSISDDLANFWGGYKVEFKVVNQKIHNEYRGDIGKLRRQAVALNPNHSPVFELEFSKFEYSGPKKEVDINGYKIYVYTPEMIVFEKLRAICQQIPEYSEIIPSFSPRARARDFYDIHLIMEMFEINPTTKENIQMIQSIFEAKKVPLSFIKDIKKHKDIHVDNWQSVKDTISPYEKVNDFNFYFDFILQTFDSISFP